MSDPFDTHTHGRFYGAAPCQSCKAKDAEIERLRGEIQAYKAEGECWAERLTEAKAALEDE